MTCPANILALLLLPYPDHVCVCVCVCIYMRKCMKINRHFFSIRLSEKSFAPRLFIFTVGATMPCRLVEPPSL